MSTPPGTNQVISLPKGGGALHGIGETFSPDLHTGTGNFTIPLAIPVGRNGFQPELNLIYSTGNGNGPFGLGWNLGISGIRRKTAKGIPLYDDAQDTFLLSGADDLVPISHDPDGTIFYRPRVEGLFARIAHRRDARQDYWEVRHKNGRIHLYGQPQPAGADQQWYDTSALFDAESPRHIFAWDLARTSDPFGNRIDYRYDRDTNPTESPHQWNQHYLTEIRYGDYGDTSSLQFLIRVRFTYEQRPDPFSDYRAGFEIRTGQRCTRIDISTHTDTDILTRTYHLAYLDQQSVIPEQAYNNGISLLGQIQVEGHDGDRSERLPPLAFAYTRFEPEQRRFFAVSGTDLPPQSLAHGQYELVDLFGKGLPDFLEMNGTVRYWRNRGNGRFDLPHMMSDAPAGISLADKGVQLIDANGDGRPDLLVTTQNVSGYYPLRFGGLWDRRSFQLYSSAPSFDLKDPEVRLVDLNGDGITDAIRSGSRLECFFNDQFKGWTADNVRQIERQAITDFPDIPFSDLRVKWADMTGDRLQDIVLVYDGHVTYWPNLGWGRWGKPITMHNSPRFPYGYDSQRILVGDVDGDGLADMIYVDHNHVTLWINQSGNAWSEGIIIRGTPPFTNSDAVRLVDLLGSGISGVLWSSDATNNAYANLFFLDFTGATKPYLLSQMDNHLGSVTRIGYAPSTQFYLADEQRPQTRWKTPLPFPVQVVARVEIIDAISNGKLTTEYSYHHGYWDGVEREFHGFGRVDHRDTETFADFHTAGLHTEERPFQAVAEHAFSPPRETRTWFHQGAIGDAFEGSEETDFSPEFWPGDAQALARPQAMTEALKGLASPARREALRALRGQILRTELYALDGTERQNRPYTVTEHLQGVREEFAPPPGDTGEQQHPSVFFPHLLAERTAQWERGSEPLTRYTFTDDYDSYGQPHTSISIGVPRGRNEQEAGPPGTPYLETHTRTMYATPDGSEQYIVDRIARTTTYEVINDGSAPLFEFLAAIKSGTSQQQVIGQTLNFYDGDAFEGLPLGHIGSCGVLVRTDILVLTEDILHNAYTAGGTISDPAREPPYLVGSTWTDDYPETFRALLPWLAGYNFRPGGSDPDNVRGYFTSTTRRRYDFHEAPVGRGLPTVSRDALGRDTTIAYDRFALLPTSVTDSAGLTTTATYDYRVLQPVEVTDTNGNRTRYAFTPLGMLQSAALLGKAGADEGDTPEAPGTQFIYDFLAFAERGQPISVRTIRRVHHVSDGDVPQEERDETIETIEYSDSFGRLVQTRAQAEDLIFGDLVFGESLLPLDQSLAIGDVTGQRFAETTVPHVVVSGWQTYDNKGRVIEKYEPFFSSDWNFRTPDAEHDISGHSVLGQKVTLFYDPQGRVVRIINPNGSERRTLYGVPGSIAAPDVSNPDIFEPTPWEHYIYDENDMAGQTHPDSALAYQEHWNTPTSRIVDALERVIETVERNGPDQAANRSHTQCYYDIRGNLLAIIDALGRQAIRYVYDLRPKRDEQDEGPRMLRIEQLDSGVKRMIFDAAGNEIERRDSKGAFILHGYDAAQRLVSLWSSDGTGLTLTLRQHLVYGDSAEAGLIAEQAISLNVRGRPFRQYDEAGLLTLERYDFKGNILEKTRQVISDGHIGSVFQSAAGSNWQIPAFQVDWQPPEGTLFDAYAATVLDSTRYQTSVAYDALNRMRSVRHPEDVEGKRRLLLPHYNRAGVLERVELDGQPFVVHIAHNARGQRTLIAYGNGIMTRYTYDSKTFRLARLFSGRYTQPDPVTYHPAGTVLQDMAYEYDLHGNLLSMHDRTPGSGLPTNPDQLDRTFRYDPLYRLLSATGRECDLPMPPPPWLDKPRCADLTRTRNYTEQYTYDSMGNLLRLEHQTGDQSFNRSLALTAGSNRLATLLFGSARFDYSYDANGNLLQEGNTRHFAWNHLDHLRAYATQTDAAEPSIYAHYLYDADGQRVKKLVRKQGGQLESTVYIDELFEHQSVGTQENNTLHIMDSHKRIATLRVGDPLPADATPAVKYHLGDQLGSSNVVIDASGAWLNREEFTPYGETSFGSFARKRYRFSGKERDEESGLSYHGERYYSPWLCRWLSIDPLALAHITRFLQHGIHLNPYAYVSGNPTNLVDLSGLEARNFAIVLSPDVIQPKLAEESKKYAESLKGYTVLQVKSLEDLVSQVKGQLGQKDTIANIVIVTHGTPGEKQKQDPEFFLPNRDGTVRWQSRVTLQNAARELTGLKDIQRATTDKTLISFRGCDLGRSDATLISIGQFFGGRGVRVEAARVGAEYRWSEKPGELTRVGVVVGKRFFDFTSKAAQPYINRLKVNQGPFEVGPGQQPLGPKPDVEIPVFQRRRP